jgi:hypothetical protein
MARLNAPAPRLDSPRDSLWIELSAASAGASSRTWRASNGSVLKIRQATNPEPLHREIYATLGISAELIKPLRTWHEA